MRRGKNNRTMSFKSNRKVSKGKKVTGRRKAVPGRGLRRNKVGYQPVNYNQEYDKGFDEAYNEGFNVGYSEGMNAGHQDA